MSTLKVGAIQSTTGNAAVTVANNGVATFASPPQGTGKVLQVKQATDETQRTITSTSYATASNTLTVNITPAATSSKMLVSFATESYFATNNISHYLTVYRDSTDIGNSSGYGLARAFSSSSDISMGMNGTILDSPNTTSQITYQVYAKVGSGSGPVYFNSQTIGTLTVMEIGG